MYFVVSLICVYKKVKVVYIKLYKRLIGGKIGKFKNVGVKLK